MDIKINIYRNKYSINILIFKAIFYYSLRVRTFVAKPTYFCGKGYVLLWQTYVLLWIGVFITI